MTEVFQTNAPHAEGLRLTEIAPGQSGDAAGFIVFTTPIYEVHEDGEESRLESARWEITRDEGAASFTAIRFGFLCDAFGNPDERPEQDWDPVEALSFEDMLLAIAAVEKNIQTTADLHNKEN